MNTIKAKVMKRIILTFIFSGVLLSVSAQTTQKAEWKTYLDGYPIEKITDAGDYLWMTDGKGVMEFNKQTEAFRYYKIDHLEVSPDDYFTSIITSIACDENGMPWVGARFIGVLSMNEDKDWILLPPVNEEQFKSWGNVVFLIASNDVVWTAMTGFTDSQPMIVKYQGTTTETILSDWPIASITEDKEGNLWSGRIDGGAFLGHDHYESLAKYDGETWTTYSSPLALGPPPFGITNITFDDPGNIWMVGAFGIMDNWETKLVKFNYSEWEVYDLPVEAHIWSLTLENDTIVWLGTSKGLMKFSNMQWTVYDADNSGLPSNYIKSVVVDSNGTKWLGTIAGLVSFNGLDADDQPGANNGNGIALSAPYYSEKKKDIELFPNPAQDYITLITPEEFKNSTVDILNIRGD
ncbi:MAG: hypothetical protein JXR52_01435, partial [Bacteroidales bacterium]|nr:hypothetical protein [Bacteroidales bacterium]